MKDTDRASLSIQLTTFMTTRGSEHSPSPSTILKDQINKIAEQTSYQRWLTTSLSIQAMAIQKI